LKVLALCTTVFLADPVMEQTIASAVVDNTTTAFLLSIDGLTTRNACVLSWLMRHSMTLAKLPTLRRYPGRKEEQWWLVLGDTKANTLLAIKRVKLARASNVTLPFVAPAAPGPTRLMLYFMCDSYMGADQEYEARTRCVLASRPLVSANHAISEGV
jgi:hypothetical protein